MLQTKIYALETEKHHHECISTLSRLDHQQLPHLERIWRKLQQIKTGNKEGEGRNVIGKQDENLTTDG